MRFAALSLSLAAGFAVAYPAGSVLKHYDVRWTTIREFNTQPPPNPNKYPPRVRELRGYFAASDSVAGSQAIIGDDGSGSPALKKLVLVYDFHGTQWLNGWIFWSYRRQEGPRKDLGVTGTGDTDMTIAWGLVTGWTVTGGFWCNSDVPYYCDFAGLKNLTTVEPPLYSTYYDLGTWTFHGTGFTAVPFVQQVAAPTSMSVGNAQYLLRGRLAAGLVPAVPVLGVALLGASLLLAGARLSRKR